MITKQTSGSVPLFSIDYAAPKGPLKQFVTMFYRFEIGGPIPGDHERADIAHVRINFGADSLIRCSDGTEHPVRDATLIGPRNSATWVESSGVHQVFGFGLMPAGWHALTGGANAADHADTTLPAGQLMGPLADQLRDLVADMVDVQTLAARVEPVLEEACLRADNSLMWFISAVEDWIGASLVPDFDALVEKTGLSHRKAETLLKQLYGAPPKLFMRKCKALRVANRMAHGEGDWQDYLDEGFYDQSHFIREIKHFTGSTPMVIRETRTTMNQIQFQRRRALAAGQEG